MKMRFLVITSVLWTAAVVEGVPVEQGVTGSSVSGVTGVLPSPTTAATTTGRPGVRKLGPKKMIRTTEDRLKEKRVEKENKYLNAEDRAAAEYELSSEALMNDIYTKGRERRKMKGVLSAYLLAHLALTAIRSYTVVEPRFNVLFTSIHALLEKLLPNIEDRWVERQTELQGLMWDYLDRHSITDPPSKVRIFHGSNSVTIPLLKKSRDAPLPEEFRDIGQTSYAMYKNIVF